MLCGDTSPPSLKEKFHELLQHFASTADLDGTVGGMAAAFVSKLTALPQDYFAIDDPDHIGLETIVERAPGVICRVVHEGDKVTLHAPGTQIDGPVSIAPALHFISRTPRFTPRDLPDGLTSDAKLALVRRLVRERLLAVMNQPA